MRALPQPGLRVPGDHPVLEDGLDGVRVELDALEEVLEQAADENLLVCYRSGWRLARHRLEVT